MTSYSPAYKAEALASMGQQPNLAGGMNNQMPGQVPNMGVPNMGVPPAPMPYPPQPMFGMPQTYSPYPQQSTFGNPYTQQQVYGQTSYSPASSPMGQQMNWNAIPDFRQFGNMGGQQPPPGQGSRWLGGDQQMEDFNTRLRASEASVRQQMGLPMYGGEDNPRFQAAMREQQNSIRQQMGLPQPGMGGQQAIGGLGQTNAVPQFFTDYANQILTKQPANTPQYTTYSAGPMGLPVSIDQSLMGGAATGNQQPTLAQWLAQTKSEMDAMLATKPQPSNQPSPYKGYGGYDMTGMSPTLQAYLKDASVQSAMDAAPYYTYNPTTKSFQAITMGGGFDKTLAEMEADAAAWDTRQKSLFTADQSPFGVKPIATPTIKPPTPNIAPKPKPIPQQISQRMIELQSKVLGPSYKRTADLQNFLNKLPKTGLTPRQVMAQQQAQQQLRNEEGLRRPYLFSQPTF